MQTIRIQTTQNVVIEYQPASVGDRILANLFDLLVILVYFVTVVTFINRLQWNPSGAGWAIISLPPAFYHLFSEIAMDGQTLGMKLIKIKVMRLDGSPPSLFNYLLRWLFRLVDVWFGWGTIAVVTIAASGRGQRLGDIAAGTAVVSLRSQADLDDTRLPTIDENYAPVYPQAIHLSDRDVGIIKEALRVYSNSSSPDPALIEALTRKVKELLRVDEPVAPISFLHTVLRDHTYLTAHV